MWPLVEADLVNLAYRSLGENFDLIQEFSASTEKSWLNSATVTLEPIDFPFLADMAERDGEGLAVDCGLDVQLHFVGGGLLSPSDAEALDVAKGIHQLFSHSVTELAGVCVHET